MDEVEMGIAEGKNLALERLKGMPASECRPSAVSLGSIGGASYDCSSLELNDLAPALAKAQGQIVTAKADKENPFHKSRYADLADVWDACRDPLSENGLSVVQSTRVLPGNVTAWVLEGPWKGAQLVQREIPNVELVTTLLHASGQWMRSYRPLRPAIDNEQGWSSSTTYARRYGLAAMVGVAPRGEDDDGNAASGLKPERTQKKVKKGPPKPDAKAPEANRNLLFDYAAQQWGVDVEDAKNKCLALLGLAGEGEMTEAHLAEMRAWPNKGSDQWGPASADASAQ